MSQTPLFPDAEGEPEPPPAAPDIGPAPPPRLRRPNRRQVTMRPCALEDLVPDGHDVRTAWAVVQSWDLARSLDAIRARGGAPGRSATDPRLLVALWLFAATEGVASARELDRLCRESDPYNWLCGGVSLNYHTLADFRVGHEAALDGLLTQMLTVLIRGGAVAVHRVAQDGTRVRVSAGANSFKRRETLEQAAQKARDHMALIKRQAERLGETTARRQAAQQRAAREKRQRLDHALKELAEVERAKARQKDKPTKANPPRASTTDPEARFLRMPDGGTRPAYNVQLAVDTESRAVVGVGLTNAGSDAGQDGPMRDQIAGRTAAGVDEHLIDGGYVKPEAIDRAAEVGVTLYMPVPRPRKAGADLHAAKRGDSAAVAAWRQRMGTAEEGCLQGAGGDGRDGQRGAEGRARAEPVPGARLAQGAVRGAVERVGLQRGAPGGAVAGVGQLRVVGVRQAP